MSKRRRSGLDATSMVARSLLALGLSFIASLISACGSTPQSLGVQSNVSSSAVVLRLRSPGEPIAFASMLRVSIRAAVFGQPLEGQLEASFIRRIDALGEEGWVSIIDVPSQIRLTLTRSGHAHSTIHDGTSTPPLRYVLDPRGRPMPTPLGISAPAGVAPAHPIELALLEPFLRALEYPALAISPGGQWESRGTVRLPDIDPGLAGEISYRLLERLDRFEGTGEQRTATISFEALLDGTLGASSAIASTQLPSSDGLRAELRVRGAYSVALSDGFARAGRAELEGEISLGEVAQAISWSGTIEWSAVPLMSQVGSSHPH